MVTRETQHCGARSAATGSSSSNAITGAWSDDMAASEERTSTLLI